jgi:predicted DNA-binding protein (MmcQ/YjbR family)
MSKPSKKHPHDSVRLKLRAFGLKYPGAVLKRPWPEHLDLAVKDKTFAFMNVEGLPLKISCKLSRSRADAMDLPFASPTRYGLGRSGWVSAAFEADEQPPLELLKQWIDESYRAQAPKSAIALLDSKTSETSARAASKKPREPVRRPKKTSKTKTSSRGRS